MNIFIFRAAEEQNGRTKDKIPYSWENEIKKSLALKQTKSLIFYPIEWLLWEICPLSPSARNQSFHLFGHKARSKYKVSAQLSIYTVLQEMF